MTGAASMAIDSCPIEGFEKTEVEDLLKIDTKMYQAALLLPFGYRLNPATTHIRLPFEEVVEFIK